MATEESVSEPLSATRQLWDELALRAVDNLRRDLERPSCAIDRSNWPASPEAKHLADVMDSIRKEERERCAKIADEFANKTPELGDAWLDGEIAAGRDIAAKIRSGE